MVVYEKKYPYICHMKNEILKYLYIDESCYLKNDSTDVMCIAGIVVPEVYIGEYKRMIKEIKFSHGIRHELKWNTISNTSIDLYRELIDFFFSSKMELRAILIKNKKNLSADNLTSNQYNDYYYALIEKLIRFTARHGNESECIKRVFLDFKDAYGVNKLMRISSNLNKSAGIESRIEAMQNIRSHESVFIQMADIMAGAISYRARNLNTGKAKCAIIHMIESLSGYCLSEGTEPGDDKFSIYDFQPRRRYGEC